MNLKKILLKLRERGHISDEMLREELRVVRGEQSRSCKRCSRLRGTPCAPDCDTFVLVDCWGRVRFVSHTRPHSNMQPEDLIGLRLHEVNAHPVEAVMESMSLAMETGQCQEIAVRLLISDGQETSLRVEIHPPDDEAGLFPIWCWDSEPGKQSLRP